MIVWVVVNGERCEGGDVVSIHSTKDDAINAALAVKTHFDGGWIGEFPYWVNGCDFVTVEEHAVAAEQETRDAD